MEKKSWGIRLAHLPTEIAVLCAGDLVPHDDDVGSLVEFAFGLGAFEVGYGQLPGLRVANVRLSFN